MAMATSVKMPQRAMRVRPTGVRRTTHVTKALLDTNLVISGATATMLGLGRFAFLGFQRKSSAQAAAPKTEGTTYFDDLQKPSSFITSTNDPAGFNLIDVMAWGSLGHALGYAILAISSNGYDGPFS